MFGLLSAIMLMGVVDTSDATQADYYSAPKQTQIIGKYVRKDYRYRPLEVAENSEGYYTKSSFCRLNTDHVVSLHDIHYSGGHAFSRQKKAEVANDRNNLRLSCANVNRIKSNLKPRALWRTMVIGRQADIDWDAESWCEYVGIYYRFKKTYDLSFKQNYATIFRECGFEIQNGILTDVPDYSLDFE